MTQKNIAIIIGSLRRDSFNAKLAAALAKLAPAEFTFTTVEIGDLPLYNQDDDADRRACGVPVIDTFAPSNNRASRRHQNH